MTKGAMVLGCAAILATASLAACGGGAEGTYKLDKASTKKAWEADAAKLPPKERDTAKLGIALVDALEGTLDLKPGGALVQTSSTPGLNTKPTAPKVETGTWKKTDGGITLTVGGSDIKCTQADKHLTCGTPKSQKGGGTLIWTKS